jgi:hypothetical protein
MSTAVAEVLDAWRAAERLVDELPPLDPDHEPVRTAIASLRSHYQILTSLRDPTIDMVEASQRTIARVQALIVAAEARRARERRIDDAGPSRYEEAAGLPD